MEIGAIGRVHSPGKPPRAIGGLDESHEIRGVFVVASAVAPPTLAPALGSRPSPGPEVLLRLAARWAGTVRITINYSPHHTGSPVGLLPGSQLALVRGRAVLIAKPRKSASLEEG